MYQLTSNNHTLKIDHPLIMGIINCTPDSFYAGSRFQQLDEAKQVIDQMIFDGADMLDIGGRSTRPGSVEITSTEEMKRVGAVIEYIAKTYPNIWMSIDTTKASVATFGIDQGCRIINDISCGTMDDEMIQTVSHLRVPFICMHIQGRPETMQINPQYTQVTNDIKFYFEDKIKLLQTYDIEQIVLDPGFGFGKTLEDNYTILNELDGFTSFGKPVMVGLSRKSMIYKLLNISPEASLNGTCALHLQALLKGANILRVHDVKPAKEIIKLHQRLLG